MLAVASAHSPLAAAKARLCSACGICCDGTMFDLVRLEQGDPAKELAALGLKLKRKHGAPSFQQPCSAFRGSHCAIYAARPERCRVFECGQLRQLAVGTTSEEEARAKIGEARGRVAQITALLAELGEKRPRRRLRQRCEDALAQAAEVFENTAREQIRTELADSMRALEQLLDAHFRVAPG